MSLPLLPRRPDFPPRLIFERLLPPELSARTNHYMVMKLTGKAERSGLVRRYQPADVRVVRLALVASAAGAPRRPLFVVRGLRRRCGKSVITANLASALAFMGYRVLCLDLDAQADLTSYLGVPPIGCAADAGYAPALSRYMRYRQAVELEALTTPVLADGMLDLLPGAVALGPLVDTINGRDDGMSLVQGMLADHAAFLDRYDVVLVDCPPGGGRLQRAFMRSADAVLMPTGCDACALAAAAALADEMQEWAETWGCSLTLLPIANRFPVDEPARGMALAALARAVEPWHLDETVFPVCPELDIRLPAAPQGQVLTAVEAGPLGAVARQFYGLGRRLLGAR